MKLLIKPLILFFIVYCLSVSTVSAKINIPDKPVNYVVDLASIIDDNIEANLNKFLKELEQKTSAQVVILTIQSLQGESIEDLSLSIAHDKWKLGQKGKDNGLLLLVSLQDRKYRFQIGYDLEVILPDSYVGKLGREYLVPYFKKGDYSTGIFSASLAVINVIAADSRVQIAGLPKLQSVPHHITQKIAKDKFDEFTRKNDIEHWLSMEELSVNPFIYKGNKVAIVSTFNTMITATEGVFKSGGESFVVSKIPKGLFKSKERVVLAGRVLGKKEIKMGLSLLLPHLKYIGVHFCEDWKCSDIIPDNKGQNKVKF